MSLSDVEYSRMRPQPVQVRLQVCNGSSCKTMANLGVLRILCLMMWLAIFFVSAKGKRINYLIETNSVEISGNEPGAFVEAGSAFIKCPTPGRKKSMGETLWVVLIPLQPAANNPNATSIASRSRLQFNLTCRV